MTEVDCLHDMRPLPELPGFTPALMAEIQALEYHGSPALVVDEAGWTELRRVLATFLDDVEVGEAIATRRPPRLTKQSRTELERRVLVPLRKVKKGIQSFADDTDIARRLGMVAGGRPSITYLVDEALELIQTALGEDKPSESEATRLEAALADWWRARSRGKASLAKNVDVSAYQQFLRLCFGALPHALSHDYDVLRKQRAQHEQYERELKRLGDYLRSLKPN